MKDKITTGLTEIEAAEYLELGKIKLVNVKKAQLARYIELERKITMGVK